MMYLKQFVLLAFFCGWAKSESSDDIAHEILRANGPDFDAVDRTLGKYETWIFSLLASCIIGFSGIVPIIFIPMEISAGLGQEGGGKLLRLFLSFAVGGLLGDVFLHLLPEAWNHQKTTGAEVGSSPMTLGLWVLLGMFSFVVLEIMFTTSKTDSNNMPKDAKNSFTCDKDSKSSILNGHFASSDQRTVYHQKSPELNGHTTKALKETSTNQTIHISGYLNLMANSIDNFTHGLAVAASFLVGCKMGMLTTFAILIHEIPHEIGDFAILLKSGFHPLSAAKAQISTATIGVLGVIVALSAESIDKVGICTTWILPFTAGGFLNIALINVLPDLLNEKDAWESLKQLVCICAGIGVMGVVSLLV